MMVLALIIFAIFVSVYQLVRCNRAFGRKPDGERLARIKNSTNYVDGKFQNPVVTNVQVDDVPYLKLIKEFFSTTGDRVPKEKIQVEPIDQSRFHHSRDSVSICWLGHSTLLIEVDGKVILIDPVFSQRVSPFSFIGTKAFPYSENYSLETLPEIDLVLISHDHYDHLDYQTIKNLKNTDVQFVTALGVGAHLEYWGISPSRITELDWWEDYQFTHEILFTAAPARHFSGRGLADRFSTLWASWIIAGSKTKLFFGADSGYYPGFIKIGEKYGPFDIAMLECGQYSQYWPFIHMMPEETLKASDDLKAKALLPIHWGKYKLSIHPWTEPVDRLLAARDNENTEIVTPRIGQVFNLNSPFPKKRWWKNEYHEN